MGKKPFVPQSPHPEFQDTQQAIDFENLFQAYHHYIYKYEVGYEEDFTPDWPWHQRNTFKEELAKGYEHLYGLKEHVENML